MARVLITGANGFIGSAINRRLEASKQFGVIPVVRRNTDGSSYIEVGEIDGLTQWDGFLDGVDTIIHSAAAVDDKSVSRVQQAFECRRVNVEGTLKLAAQAVKADVRRFIFLSSIKVNGENTFLNRRFSVEDIPSPQYPYGRSKLEAEQSLFELAKKSNMDIVIIRPPLVYGPGVKGNFRSMVNWVKKGLPLPFGAIDNKRSFIAIDNLVDLIVKCIDHPAAANDVFLAGDGEDLSTSELLVRLGEALGKPVRIFSPPVSLINLGATLLGKKELAKRLCGSLQVDISRTKELLDWEPSTSIDEGLRKVAKNIR